MEHELFHSSGKMAIANHYNDWTFSLFEQYVRGRVLEVGCGVGSFTQRLVRQGRFDSLLSIDLSQQAIESCRSRIQHPNLRFEALDVVSVKGTFDLVICMNVIEHIEDDCAALRRMLDVLAPGGTLFLLVPAHQALFTPYDQAVGHFRRYDKNSMQRLFARCVGGSATSFRQFYFNVIGAIGSVVVYRLFHKVPESDTSGEIGFFDRAIVPIARRLEPRFLPFGLSLVTIAGKGPQK